LRKALDTDHADPPHNSSFSTTRFRHYNRLQVTLRSGNSVRSYSGSLLDLTGKGEFTTQRNLCERSLWNAPQRARKRDRDRQIERGALFLNLSRSKIHEDLLRSVKATVL
jgi:hypothetical protein